MAQDVTSFCVECDAEPGGCNHQAARYLDAAELDRTPQGWKVPAHERDRWDNPPRFAKAARPTVMAREPKTVQRIVAELEQWMFLDRQLEQQLRDAHDREPLRVTLLTESIVERAAAGALDNPAGLLAVKLRDMTKGTE